MSGFKIIAIKTGKKEKINRNVRGNSSTLNPLKILKGNTIYSFDSSFKFNNNNIYEATILKNDSSLYDLTINEKKLSININAIVGKNGSGKSSLIELLYWANYNISATLGILVNEETGEKYKPYQVVDLEILYSTTDKEIIRIIIKDKMVHKQEFMVVDGKLTPKNNGNKITDRIELQDYFYSVAINYSQHALNSNEIGNWIIPLFHKNDGYQTPIVLNPMRTKGNIDINDENSLLKQRLIANLLENTNGIELAKSLRNIVNDKIATKLVLKFRKHDYVLKEYNTDDKIEIRLIKSLEGYFNFKVTISEINNDMFLNCCFQELSKKLVKISKKYKPFKRYNDKESGQIKDVNAFMRKVFNSNSHIVFKVKGLILYMKYFQLIFDKDANHWERKVTLDIQKLSERIQEISENYWVNTTMLVPPKIFDVDIVLNDNLSMDLLSSGEKQKVHSISSIIYHIINLNSVNKLQKDIILEEEYFGYKYINLLLDEIELYYHPEWQRSYFNELLNYISKINHKNIDEIKGINIIVLTHSPFILSDIPNEYILRIEDGYPKPVSINTFGANIHELLSHSFFMTSTTGEFAKQSINDIILLYNKVRNEIMLSSDTTILRKEYLMKKEKFQYILDNTGEDIIRNLMKNHLAFIDENLKS